MTEIRKPVRPGAADARRWQEEFEELELRMDALRQAFTEAIRSFEMAEETVERIHARFDDLGEQVHAMHCTYPFGGWPGQEDCRFEPRIPYETEARGAGD
jgi:hypothetical protein